MTFEEWAEKYKHIFLLPSMGKEKAEEMWDEVYSEGYEKGYEDSANDSATNSEDWDDMPLL